MPSFFRTWPFATPPNFGSTSVCSPVPRHPFVLPICRAESFQPFCPPRNAGSSAPSPHTHKNPPLLVLSLAMSFSSLALPSPCTAGWDILRPWVLLPPEYSLPSFSSKEYYSLQPGLPIVSQIHACLVYLKQNIYFYVFATLPQLFFLLP